LSTVTYDTSGTTLSKIGTPGTFLYWVQFQVTSTGDQSFTITQSTTYQPTTGTPIFDLMGGTSAYDGSCQTLATTVTGSGASVTVSFTAAATGSFVIGVKYVTHNIIGSSPASSTPGFTYNYTFTTTGLGGSTQGVLLTHV
jgi:hypothetical protein